MKKILIWILVLIILGLAAAYLGRNMIVAGAIEKGGTYATGVDTRLGSANLALSAGSLELNDYEIDNPSGFVTPEFISIGFGMLDVNSGSVFADTVEIDSLILQNVKVTLEVKDGKSNYNALMDHMTKLDFGSSENKTNLRIRKIAISEIRVEASITLPGINHIEEAFEIDNIVLKDVGDNGKAGIARVTSIIIQAIVKKALAESRNKLPGDVGKYFDDIGKSGLDKVTTDVKEKVESLGESLLGRDKKKK